MPALSPTMRGLASVMATGSGHHGGAAALISSSMMTSEGASRMSSVLGEGQAPGANLRPGGFSPKPVDQLHQHALLVLVGLSTAVSTLSGGHAHVGADHQRLHILGEARATVAQPGYRNW